MTLLIIRCFYTTVALAHSELLSRGVSTSHQQVTAAAPDWLPAAGVHGPAQPTSSSLVTQHVTSSPAMVSSVAVWVLDEVDGVGARVWVLVHLEVVGGKSKRSQHQVPQVLQLT